MNDPTTLPEFLDLAVSAGVPAEAMERAGFYYIQGIWEVENNLGERFAVTALRGDCETRATLAAERVVIEWLGTLDYYAIPNGTEWRVVKIVHDENGCNAVLHWVTSLHPTLSAALTAALRQIKEARDA